MEKEIQIAQATPADLDAIVETEHVCFDSDCFTRRQFAYLVSRAKGVFYVIREEGKIIAYISLLSNARTRNLRIYSIAVRPEARGRKLGQLLIDRCIGYATENQLKAITLEVKVTNTPAIGLYEKNGFEKISLIPHYYHDGSDAFGMKRITVNT